MNRVLQRQFKKLGLALDKAPTAEQWAEFIQLIEASYTASELDRDLIERSLSIMSREMQERWDAQQAHEKVIEQQRAKLVTTTKMAALGEMAGGIAHEINTPLSIITIAVETMNEMVNADNFDKQALLEFIEMINDTAVRIDKIVKSLRSFSRDGGSEPMSSVPVQQIFTETLALCRERFHQNGIKVIEPQNIGDVLLNCRSVEVSQVLLNLLSNSCDAIQNLSDRWIKIDCINAVIEIAVTDSGPGISQVVREKMMQPFFTTKEIGKGTGVGLSISKGIMESHGGKLFYDEQSANTRFVMQFPIALPTQQAA